MARKNQSKTTRELRERSSRRMKKMPAIRKVVAGAKPKAMAKPKSKTKKTGRTQKRIVAVSGGFDPVHIGHVRMFNEAKKLGDHLVVIINNDNWLKKKKGYAFMPEAERVEVIRGFRAVDEIFLTIHPENPTDMSVCAELRAVRPHIFANGGDRVHENTPEVAVCRDIGAEMVFSVGHGGKVQSSSWLVGKLKK
jgi:D-beta-D-heptose 7-phosphate kinase/D-beta-D-heptose 1-phosphate adenosyltransferase